MQILGFIKWQFGGFYKDLTFWGMIVGLVAILAAYFGCPKPIPAVMLGIGIMMVLFDVGRSWFRFSYSLYRMEQNEMIRKLKEKEQS